MCPKVLLGFFDIRICQIEIANIIPFNVLLFLKEESSFRHRNSPDAIFICEKSLRGLMPFAVKLIFLGLPDYKVLDRLDR